MKEDDGRKEGRKIMEPAAAAPAFSFFFPFLPFLFSLTLRKGRKEDDERKEGRRRKEGRKEGRKMTDGER